MTELANQVLDFLKEFSNSKILDTKSNPIDLAHRLLDISLKDGRIILDLASDNLDLSKKEVIEGLIQNQWAFADHGKPLVNFRRRENLVGGALNQSPTPTKFRGSPFGIKPQRIRIEGIQNVIVVYSAKGGVGKSTISCNLAWSLKELGYKVGILDADLHGPSIPDMLGIQGAVRVTEDDKILPHDSDGLKVVSFGFFTDKYTPFISRGAIVSKSLRKLVFQTAWGELDYLIIDLPPGTGDVQISLAEEVEIDGAVIVSTPQGIALLDAHKGLSLFEKLEIPVLGMIENMSMYTCSNCGHSEHIFGSEGESFAEERDILMLGRIPLDRRVGTVDESGQTIGAKAPQFREIFSQIAQRVVDGM